MALAEFSLPEPGSQSPSQCKSKGSNAGTTVPPLFPTFYYENFKHVEKLNSFSIGYMNPHQDSINKFYLLCLLYRFLHQFILLFLTISKYIRIWGSFPGSLPLDVNPWPLLEAFQVSFKQVWLALASEFSPVGVQQTRVKGV